MRKTKIICTLGPATEKPETIRGLLSAGADIFRLNMSHAKHEWVREIIPRIRKIAAEIPRPAAILLDTQGPAIRTGELKSAAYQPAGDVALQRRCHLSRPEIPVHPGTAAARHTGNDAAREAHMREPAAAFTGLAGRSNRNW